MTWDAFHRRGEVLRAVADEADARRDGMLPTDIPGVDVTFSDEVDLLAALQMRWHTRLAGMIERALMDQPTDLEQAVADAWQATAAELAGIRAVLDRYSDAPSSERMATVLGTARRKEWAMVAAMAGLAAPGDPRGAEAGRRLEQRARSSVALAA